LDVLPVKFTPIEATICEGEACNFNGKTCAETGVYRDTLTSVNGCDSIVELKLTVNQLEPTFIDANICSGKSYSWGNKVYLYIQVRSARKSQLMVAGGEPPATIN
jgi:hypothetical protein